MMSGDGEVPIKARLCVLRMWPDFQGYGFNLHGEKGKAGHFIGEVEDNSPAEAAGLLSKDRLIEVNGFNVNAESHKAVVERIKAGGGCVSMLVVEEAVERLAIERGIIISEASVEVDRHETPETSPVYLEHRVTVESAPHEEAAPERTEEEQRQYEEAVADSVAAAAMESIDKEEESAPAQREPTPEPAPVTESEPPTNGMASEPPEPAANGPEQMSVAEYMARLKSQKKTDPRRTNTSFKDKTLMFEKM